MPDRRARGRLPKLEPLPAEIARHCYAIGDRVEVPKGTYLYRQGDPAERVYLISDGFAKVTSESPEGHSIVVAFLGPRYTIGLAGMFLPNVYVFNAVAVDQLPREQRPVRLVSCSCSPFPRSASAVRSSASG